MLSPSVYCSVTYAGCKSLRPPRLPFVLPPTPARSIGRVYMPACLHAPSIPMECVCPRAGIPDALSMPYARPYAPP